MGFFEVMGDVGHWIGDRIDDLGKFSSMLYHGDTGQEAVPAPELVRKVLSGPGTASWHAGADQANALSNRHNDAGDLLSRVNTGLESAWTGRGADAAQARIRQFAETAAVSAMIFRANSANLTDIAHGFDAMKSSLQQMPPTPPHLNFFDRISPWETDTEREISDYNALAQHNVDRYQVYVQHAGANRQNLQTNFGLPDSFGDQDIATGFNPSQGPPEKTPSAGPRPRDPKHSPNAPDGPSYDTPAPVHNPSRVAEPDVPQGPGGTSTPSLASPSRTGDQTTTSGWTTPSPDPATTRNWAPPAGGPRTSDSGSGGATSSPGLVSGIPEQGRRGNARSEGGSTGGESDRAGKNPQGETRGRTSGPPRPGTGSGPGAGERAPTATNPARGTSGSRGAPGVGGVTPARGKDDEAKDHHRKYGLDNDSAFALTDEDGERVVDPRTGLPPTPPTIGG